MKKMKLAVSVLVFASSLMVAAGCLNGNTRVRVTWSDGEVTEGCCVTVGDGSEVSCHSRGVWFNMPTPVEMLGDY